MLASWSLKYVKDSLGGKVQGRDLGKEMCEGDGLGSGWVDVRYGAHVRVRMQSGCDAEVVSGELSTPLDACNVEGFMRRLDIVDSVVEGLTIVLLIIFTLPIASKLKGICSFRKPYAEIHF